MPKEQRADYQIVRTDANTPLNIRFSGVFFVPHRLAHKRDRENLSILPAPFRECIQLLSVSPRLAGTHRLFS